MMKTLKNSEDITYGWIVALSSGFALGLSTGPMAMFGPLFMSVLHDDIATGAVETIVSVFVSMQCGAFFLGSYFSKTFGVKLSTFIAAIIFSIGNVCSAFSVNYVHLLLSYGVLVGFGSGTMYILGTSCLNDHFTEMRTVAFGLLQTMNMSIATLLPLLINRLIETYGSQGSQLLLSAIAANTIPAALLLRPAKINKFHSFEMQLTDKLLDEDAREKGTLNIVEDEKMDTSEKYIMNTSKSWTSIQHSFWKMLRGIGNSPSMKLFIRHDYMILCLGLALTTLLEVFFFALLPLYLLNYLKTSLEDTSYVMSAVGASDFGGRVFLMLVGRCVSNSNRVIYWITNTLSAVLVLLLIHVENYILVLLLACILGMARGVIYVTCGLVFSEHYCKELYSVAMGGMGLASSVINVVMAYLFGQLRDETGGYVIKYTTLVILMFGISGIWLLEVVFNKDFRRNLFRTRAKN